MFSRLFIDRPVFASVISILIVLMGAVGYVGLPVAQYPELAPPVVHVEAVYPGASAATIAATVAAPLEQEVNGVDRMIYMNSVSSDGRYTLDITFEVGTDIDMAAVLVQNRVNIAASRLPEEVRRQGVVTNKQSTALAGVISLTSLDGRTDDLTLTNFVMINWADEFRRIPGVGGLMIFPSKDYGMRVWLDPHKLKARNLTVGDVTAAISAQNVQVAAGALGRQPSVPGTDFELVVTTQGRLSTAEQFGEIFVKVENGRTVQIKDIARVELGARDYGTESRFNAKPASFMIAFQLPGANLVDITERMHETLARVTDPRRSVPLPPGCEAKFFYDSSMFIRSAIDAVNRTLVEAFVLVFIVVLVFLQSLRATFIPALTIPVSLIGSFLLMQAFGFSINMLTMFGLVLAIGIVVDDAIIVVENVERNMREHRLGAREATVRAMGEITGPILSITLVLMAVFLPTAALPGLTGQMYRQFALTIAASTGISAICALTLSPALCALILRSHHDARPLAITAPLRWAAAAFNRVLDAVTGVYVFVARTLCRFAPVGLALWAGVLVATWFISVRIPSGFVPNEDLGFIAVAAQLPDGAGMERTRAVIEKASELIRKVDGVQDVGAMTGFSLISGNSANVGNCWAVLKPWDERARSGRSIEAVMADINQVVSTFQEAQFIVFSLPPISGLGNTSGFDLRIQNKTPDAISSQVHQQVVGGLIGAAMGQAPGGEAALVAAFSPFRAGVPQVYLDIDREKVLRLGIPIESVFSTLQTDLGAAYVNDFNLAGRTFQVNLQADSRFRMRAEDILRLEVRSNTGRMIPLATFTTIQDAIGPDRIERYNMYPAATVNGITAPGTSSGAAMALMERIADDQLPSGMGYEWSAMSFQEKRIGGQGVLVFVLGVAVVYLILSALYESFATPLAVVLAIPLVIIGAMAAVWWAGLDNNVFTQIGLVLLVALGAKNSILIVEFARENRQRGVPIIDAAVAGARTRFRPIVMTSLAFILGVLPLVVATGAGAASRRALGTAVCGGMIGGTVLALLFTPMLYVVIQSLAEMVLPPKQARQTGAGPAPSASH